MRYRSLTILCGGFLPAWKEDEGVSFFRESRKNENSGLNAEYEEIFGIENENEAMRAEWIAGREAGEEEYRDESGKMIQENGDESRANNTGRRKCERENKRGDKRRTRRKQSVRTNRKRAAS